MLCRFSSFLRFIPGNRLYFLVNIAGLSIAVSIALLTGLFVYREAGHDRFNTNLKNIYCVSVDNKGYTPFNLAELIDNRIPEVSSFVRVQLWDLKFNVLRYDNNPPVDLDGIIRADTNFFEFFTYSFISGDPRSCLRIPESLVLTESSAARLFGNEDPVGKTISYNKGQMLLTVTAVIKDPPANSSIKFNAVMSVNSLPVIYPPYRESGAFFWNYESFVEINVSRPDSSMNRLASELFFQNIPEQAVKEARDIFKSKFEVKLIPFTSVYFNTGYETSMRKGNKGQIYLFCLIGILIMLIAVINYINLASASATSRIREVMIRKITGARTGNLFSGFLVESILLSFVAVAFGLIISAILTGVANRQQVTVNQLLFYNIKEQIVILIAGSILTGILAGIWPSASLAVVSPIASGKIKVLSGAFTIRKWLLIIQFFISTGLLICTIIISKQYGLMTNNPAGFESENIAYLRMGRQLKGKYGPLIDKLTGTSGVSAVATARYGFIGGRAPALNEFMCNGKAVKMNAMSFNTDTGFMEMLHIELVRGSSFKEHDNIKYKLLINETAFNMMGFKGDLQEITLPDKVHGVTWVVTGVVKDFNSRSMQYPVSPYIFYYTPGDADMDGLYVKLQNGAIIPDLIKKITDICNELAPDEVVSVEFLDDAKARLYREDETKRKVFLFFSVLSILISCMGLYALAGYMLKRRTKEICIRKICGSDEKNLFMMITSDFLKIILTGFIFVLPLSWFILNKWLQNFALKTRLAWWIFILSGLTMIIISAITIFTEIRKATSCNPADRIRYE